MNLIFCFLALGVYDIVFHCALLNCMCFKVVYWTLVEIALRWTSWHHLWLFGRRLKSLVTTIGINCTFTTTIINRAIIVIVIVIIFVIFLRVAVPPIQSFAFLPIFAIEFFSKKSDPKRFGDLGAMAVLLCLSALSYTEPPLPLRSPDKVLKIMEKLGHFMTSNLLHRPAFVWVCFVQGWTHKTRATLFNCVQICSHCKMLSGELLITWRRKLIWMPKLVEVANIKRIVVLPPLSPLTNITINYYHHPNPNQISPHHHHPLPNHHHHHHRHHHNHHNHNHHREKSFPVWQQGLRISLWSAPSFDRSSTNF